MRRVIAALIVVGLAVGVVLLWPREANDDPPVTEASGSTTTSTTTRKSTTTSVDATTTIESGSHVIETVEEAEEILRELWFGWFEGIYNQDEERIREVVILEETVETAKESFGVEFIREPRSGDIRFDDTEILRTDQDCLAVWRVTVLSGFREGSSIGVDVLRWTDSGWKSLNTWRFREDLWEADCESSLDLP